MLSLLLAYCHGTVASPQLSSISLFCAKKLKSTERESWELGRKEKKEPVLFLVITRRSQEEPLAHPLAAQMGMRPQRSRDLFKVIGHLGAEPGHCRPFHTWLGSLSSGSQNTAGLRGLEDHPLVLPVE